AAVRAEIDRLKRSAAGGSTGSSLKKTFEDATKGMVDAKNAAEDLNREIGDGQNEHGLSRNFRRARGYLDDFGKGLTKLGNIIDGGSVRGPLTFLRNALAL